MKLLVYNIAYGTGCPKTVYSHILTSHRYIKTSSAHLDRIINFIEEENPDILGLVEVDMGSYRTGFLNQVETIANHLDHFHYSSVKYHAKSMGRSIPIIRMQGNAILTRQRVPKTNFHYFPVGFKRLIIELDFKGISFFLVHLALQKNIRRIQLEFLAELASMRDKIIIAGDFNAFRGKQEIEYLQRTLGLSNPNVDSRPTFPSWNPRRELDFILVSKNIRVSDFRIPEVRFSDHLPIILEFQAK
ncbi:MAG: endonuclease/exonuclease/phosphatase family protein [Victivallales bacterium]|nr:endonuclease/exonuclease/phosphatase family protein [Victivallales bacterium]